MRAATPEPVIRPLSSEDDFAACVALQKTTWGDDFRELVPPAMLLITQHVGGVAAGAFVADRLVGFVYGLTGLKDGRPVHWSHMLAVEPAWRDRRLGRRLKRWQRDRIRALGVERMYWTFDPLVARNAHFNLDVLGARIVEYRRNLYGENPMSRTDSVIGSDRFVVEWDLSDRRTGPDDRLVRLDRPQRPLGPLVSPESPELPDGRELLVAIPRDIQTLKGTQPEVARRWREVTRAAFEHCLSAGYEVAGVRADSTAERSYYTLVRHAD